MGTGLFLGKLKNLAGDQIVPFGIDLAENMVENARRRIPDLVAAVGDAAELDILLPRPTIRLHMHAFYHGIRADGRARAARSPAGSRAGGYWSLVGGTKAAYPGLQAKGRLAAPSLA